MSGKLKIYACSGFASADAGTYNYWTDNTATITNTQAVNTMLALINRNRIDVLRLAGMTDEEKVQNLNEIDIYVLCMSAAQRYAADAKKLQYAGVVIGNMFNEGKFNYLSLDNNDRDANLDKLLDLLYERVADEHETAHNKKFELWFEKKIVMRNKVGLNFGEQQKVRKAIKKGVAGIKGIGEVNDEWKENADLAELLTKGSEYFLYMYFTQEQFEKIPAVFKLKAKKQKQTYDYCKQLFVGVYGSEDEMKEIIYAGIVDYYETTPEDVCESIVEGKAAKVARPVSGWLIATFGVKKAVEIILAIIAAVAAIVIGCVQAICNAVVAKYGALDQDALDTSVPDASDYDGISTSGLKKDDWTQYLPYLAIGAGVLILLRN